MIKRLLTGLVVICAVMLLVPALHAAGNPYATDLVAYWKLDDGLADSSTTTAEDSEGPVYNNGTLLNFADPTQNWTTGVVSWARLRTGLTSCVFSAFPFA